MQSVIFRGAYGRPNVRSVKIDGTLFLKDGEPQNIHDDVLEAFADLYEFEAVSGGAAESQSSFTPPPTINTTQEAD